VKYASILTLLAILVMTTGDATAQAVPRGSAERWEIVPADTVELYVWQQTTDTGYLWIGLRPSMTVTLEWGQDSWLCNIALTTGDSPMARAAMQSTNCFFYPDTNTWQAQFAVFEWTAHGIRKTWETNEGGFDPSTGAFNVAGGEIFILTPIPER
jgi:hypothetical protein